MDTMFLKLHSYECKQLKTQTQYGPYGANILQLM